MRIARAILEFTRIPMTCLKVSFFEEKKNFFLYIIKKILRLKFFLLQVEAFYLIWNWNFSKIYLKILKFCWWKVYFLSPTWNFFLMYLPESLRRPVAGRGRSCATYWGRGSTLMYLPGNPRRPVAGRGRSCATYWGRGSPPLLLRWVSPGARWWGARTRSPPLGARGCYYYKFSNICLNYFFFLQFVEQKFRNI